MYNVKRLKHYRLTFKITVKIYLQMKKYKQLIKQKGLKMNWIADQLCISCSALSLYLSEQRTMPIELELKLKEILR